MHTATAVMLTTGGKKGPQKSCNSGSTVSTDLEHVDGASLLCIRALAHVGWVLVLHSICMNTSCTDTVSIMTTLQQSHNPSQPNIPQVRPPAGEERWHVPDSSRHVGTEANQIFELMRFRSWLCCRYSLYQPDGRPRLANVVGGKTPCTQQKDRHTRIQPCALNMPSHAAFQGLDSLAMAVEMVNK